MTGFADSNLADSNRRTLERIAEIYEEGTGDDNQWDSGILEDVSDLLVATGYMTLCPEHGCYPATLDACPRHDDEEAPDDEPSAE